jgi:hypothetical protein
MTNITLSIEESVYKLMKKYSEIKWSEFVRISILKRIKDLEKLDKMPNKESIITMLASEDSLKKDWNNKFDDKWDSI